MNVSLFAQEISINGQKLLVGGLSIRDDKGAVITDSDLEAMTDLDSTSKLGRK